MSYIHYFLFFFGVAIPSLAHNLSVSNKKTIGC